MKTQKFLIYPLFLLIVPAMTISCKKNKDKQADCKIVTLVDVSTGSSASTTTYNFTYNNDGRISTSQASGSFTENAIFNYTGNTIIINRTGAGGTFKSRDSVSVNSKGRPDNVRQYYNTAGTNWSNFAFQYDGSGNLLKILQTSDGSPTVETSTVTMTNGNMTALSDGSSTTNLEYYTDKPVRAGDYLEVLSVIQYGVSVYPHKNMLKSISSSGYINNFSYEYNGDGTVSKLTATSSSSVETLTYQYICN